MYTEGSAVVTGTDIICSFEFKQKLQKMQKNKKKTKKKKQTNISRDLGV